MRSIDLNCDCGEGFGAYAMGDDQAMLDIVTTANVACGFHAGDPDIMTKTFALAKARHVAIGAHPGFDDRAGFGRRPMALSEVEIERLVAYQIGAAQALAGLAGHRLTHVKPHGALSNVAMSDAGIARAIARATRAVDPQLAFLAVSGHRTPARRRDRRSPDGRRDLRGSRLYRCRPSGAPRNGGRGAA